MDGFRKLSKEENVERGELKPIRIPAEANAVTSGERRININYFLIRDEGFSCSVLSREQIVESLRDELATYCRKIGFKVVNDADADQLCGEFVRIEQGSRFLRAIAPGILGAVVVEGSCRILRHGAVVKQIEFRERRALGFQGGNTRSLLEYSIRRIALQLGSAVAAAAS